MATSKDNGYQAAQYGDQRVERGTGGETHQVAAEGAPRLTTQQGTVVSDDQNTLRAGERGPDALEDFHFREKIFHFDHERIPERVVHARGYGAHGYFENYEPLTDDHPGRPVLRGRPAHAGVRPVLHRGGQQGLGRPGPRRARLRGQVLHQGGQLGPGRQQHPGLLHPGRDQVPGPDPRGQGRTRPGLPAGPDGARQLLGLRLADARVGAHADVDHVGSGHPALVPVHGGLRRAHLPAGERRGPVHVREVPLEAEAGPAVGGVERGGEDQRRRPRLPPPGPVGRHHRRRLPRVGARAAAVRRRLRRPVRLRRAGPHQAHPRGGGAGPPGRPAGPGPGGGQLLRRDRAGGVLHRRTSSPASTSPTTRCCRAGTSPTSTPSSSGWAAPTSPTCPSTRPSARSRTSSRTGTWP